MQHSPKIALVLTGGGARGAYQAGFLKGLSDISTSPISPFSIVTGCSVGAINAAYLACSAHNFQDATESLWKMWATIEPEGIFIPKPGAFLKIGFDWFTHLALRHKKHLTATLMDNMPLKNMLQHNLNFDALHESIKNNNIYAAAFTSMDYIRRISTTFFDGAETVEGWDKKGSLGKRTRLTVDHIVGSAGLPLLFEPVKIEDSYFGDGSIKLSAPLRPAVRLGADKIVVITTYELKRPKLDDTNAEEQTESYPSFGSIIGTMLQSAFSDALDIDLERLNEINHFAGTKINGKVLKHIPALEFKPTQDLSRLAADAFIKLPPSFKKFVSLISGMDCKDNTFLSYLTFEKSYTTVLLEAGYQDALSQKSLIKTFLESKD